MSASERPPVDPLREAAWKAVTWPTEANLDALSDVLRASEVASPAAPRPEGPEAFDAAVQRAFAGSGVEVRTSFTPTDDRRPGSADPAGLAEWKARHPASPAAPRPEGPCWECGSPNPLARLSDTGDTPNARVEAYVDDVGGPEGVTAAGLRAAMLGDAR